MKSYTAIAIAVLISTGCAKSLKPQQLLNDVNELSSDKYKGRKSGTAENRMAGEYIIKRFDEIGLKPFGNDYKEPFSFKTGGTASTVNGINLIGYIKGKTEDVIVVSAHYDHLGIINGQIYNGADDNASGVGALLAIAKYFVDKQPEHTLIFAAFDAEEAGLQGAKAFVNSPPLPLDKIKLNVNMDMISRSDKKELYVAGTFLYPSLKSAIITTNPNIKVLFGHDDPKLGKDDWTSQSDQGAFNAKKIPFLYFGVEDHEDYHRPTDDFSKIDKDFYTDAVGVIIESVQNIDKDISIQKIFRDKLIMKN